MYRYWQEPTDHRYQAVVKLVIKKGMSMPEASKESKIPLCKVNTIINNYVGKRVSKSMANGHGIKK